MKMYRPKFRPQYPDPTTTLDWSNCTMASGAMMLDFHTQGKVQKWGGELRKLSGDTSGGTNIDNLKTAWSKLGYTLLDRRGSTWAGVLADLKNGRGVVLQGDYDVLTGSNSCQTSFDGDHAIYVNPEAPNSSGYVVGDPLCGGWKRISASVLKAYVEKLGRRVYGTTSPQKVLYAASRAWPDPIVAPAPITGDEMIVGEGLVRTSNKFVAVAQGTPVYKDPACKTVLTTMSAAAKPDFMGTVPGFTAVWAIEIATGRIVEGKMLPVICYVKKSQSGAPTVRPVEPTYTQAQLDAAVAAAKAANDAEVAALNGRITGIKSKVAANAADVAND
jgi:hypothetical protein